MFFISPLQAYSFRCWFPTTPFDPSPKEAFSSSFEVEDVVFSSVLLIPFLHLFRRHCDVALFDPSSCFVKIMFFLLLIHLTGVLCPLLKFFSSYQVLHPFSIGVLPEFVLPCSSFLTECFQLRSSSLYSFFQFPQPPKVLWFHSFVKEAT